MPQDPTLEQLLLRKATSIGPGDSVSTVPTPHFEDQQPDPLRMLTSVLGDPVGNASLAKTPPFISEEGALLKWAPIQKLLGQLRGFNPGEAEAVQEVARTFGAKSHSGFRVGGAPQVTAPRGFEFPTEMPMKRSPDTYERAATQRHADIRDSVSKPNVPEWMRAPEAPPPAPKMSYRDGGFDVQGNPFYRDYWVRSNKPNPDIVRSVRAMGKTGVSPEDIAAKFPKLPPETLRSILSKETWAWVK